MGVGFSQGAQLRRIAIGGGTPLTVVESRSAVLGGTWSPADVIVFAPANTAPLFRVPSTGGTPVEATRLDSPRQVPHRFPHFLPDGRHFLFFAFGSPEGKGVYLGSLDSREVRRLVRTDAAAVFAPPDLVLFAQEGALVAQRLDVDTWELIGEPVTVARRVAVDVVNGVAAVSASAAGPIAYRSQSPERQLVWFDRAGQRVGSVGDADAALEGSRLAPDGRMIALIRTVDGNRDVWLMDTARPALRRFTSDPGADTGPVWSPDGNRIVFGSTGGRAISIYTKSRRTARRPRGSCWSRPRTSPQATGLPTADSFSITALIRKRAATYGCCLSLAIGSPFRLHRRRHRKAAAVFRRTADGLRISRTKVGALKSTCSRFPDLGPRCRFPLPAAQVHSGAETAASCSTKTRPTTA